MILVIGLILGLIRIAFGVYAEYGLGESITEQQMIYLSSALLWNLTTSIIIIILGIVIFFLQKEASMSGLKLGFISALWWVAWSFIISTITYCFNYYVCVAFNLDFYTARRYSKILEFFGTTILLFAYFNAKKK